MLIPEARSARPGGRPYPVLGCRSQRILHGETRENGQDHGWLTGPFRHHPVVVWESASQTYRVAYELIDWMHCRQPLESNARRPESLCTCAIPISRHWTRRTATRRSRGASPRTSRGSRIFADWVQLSDQHHYVAIRGAYSCLPEPPGPHLSRLCDPRQPTQRPGVNNPIRKEPNAGQGAVPRARGGAPRPVQTRARLNTPLDPLLCTR